MREHWSPVRQARYPRIWPQLPVSAGLAGALGYFGSAIEPVWLAMIVIVLGAWLIGWGISKARWAIWKRRHPELPVEVWFEIEVIQPRRENARWN